MDSPITPISLINGNNKDSVVLDKNDGEYFVTSLIINKYLFVIHVIYIYIYIYSLFKMILATELRVMTLNVWCLPQPWPIGSKDRLHRLKKLAEALINDPYDIIGLQEVWCESDYLEMAERLSHLYQFHHYFHSGFTGSGVCVFSRHPIVSTLTHRYSLNGFAHHIHRGDWFGGKVVGMVELEIGEMRVNFYTTHLHAEYDRENDLYLPHRTAQSFELSQFVRHTSRGADVVIVVGDLNMEPEDLGFRLILSQAKLFDAWRLCHEESSSGSSDSLSKCRGITRGGTCDRPDNCYSHSKFKDNDESKRIDYILFKSGRMNVSIDKCDITMNKIPGEEINYSDHVGLVACFTVQSGQRQQSILCEPNRPLLIEAIGIVSGGQRRARRDRAQFLCAAVAILLLVLVSCLLDVQYPFLSWGLSILRFSLTVIVAFCVWQGFIGLTLERKALKASKQSMQQLLND
uniref:sphingomyelin phosphodiesterase n=1 Tax=Heterorhabditis bacteriophora TaxID=37862 RepID=A0A1I7X1N0_HETBA